MAGDLQMSPQMEQIHGEIRDNFRALAYDLDSSPSFFFLVTIVVLVVIPKVEPSISICF